MKGGKEPLIGSVSDQKNHSKINTGVSTTLCLGKDVTLAVTCKSLPDVFPPSPFRLEAPGNVVLVILLMFFIVLPCIMYYLTVHDFELYINEFILYILCELLFLLKIVCKHTKAHSFVLFCNLFIFHCSVLLHWLKRALFFLSFNPLLLVMGISVIYSFCH